MLDRMHQAKGLIEEGFYPHSYDTGLGGYCAIGAYAKTFAVGRENAGGHLGDLEAQEGFRVLNEAAFIVTGGQWNNIENLAMRTEDKALVLRVYDKAIELAGGQAPLVKVVESSEQPVGVS